MGDFSISFVNHDDINVQNLVNHSIHFFSAMNKPTRVTSKSATLIDLICTNNFDNHKTSGIIFSSISDHFPIFSTFFIASNLSNSSSTFFTKPKFSNDNIDALKVDLVNFMLRLVYLKCQVSLLDENVNFYDHREAGQEQREQLKNNNINFPG